MSIKRITQKYSWVLTDKPFFFVYARLSIITPKIYTGICRNAPFIGMEFRLPHDLETPQMCLLCSRATTQKCFYDMCYTGKPTRGVIQRYGNIFGQPGEYSVECMLICPRAIGLASMPVPCMSHQRNRYSVITQGGVKHLKQHRVRYEDYHQAAGGRYSPPFLMLGVPKSF